MSTHRLLISQIAVSMIVLMLFANASSIARAQNLSDLLAFGNTQTAPDLWWQTTNSGNLEKLKKINEKGPYVHARDDRGFTALIVALNEGHQPVIDWLLANGANPNDVTYFGYTTLMAGCAKNNAAFVERAIKAGASVNAQLSRQDGGNTAMHFAVFNRSTDCLDVLMANDADMKIPNRSNLTPMGWALYQGRFTVFKHLMDKGVNPAEHDLTPGWLMYYAIKHNRPDLVLKFGQLGMTVDRHRTASAIDVAFDLYHLDCARALLQITRWSENTEVDLQEQHIIDAILDADITKLKTLAPMMSQTCRRDFIEISLVFAKHRRHLDMPRIIKDANFETYVQFAFHSNLQTQILKAISKRDWTQVQACVFAGADLNDPKFNREIYIRLATNARHAPFVQWLMAHGYKIRKSSLDAADPIGKAISSKDYPFVEAMLKLGAPVGPHAIPLALRYGDEKMVQVLLSDLSKVDFDTQYFEREPVDLLEFASHQGSTQSIKQMLRQAISASGLSSSNGGDE